MDCTQVLYSESYEEVNSTNDRIPVATLEIGGIFYTIFNSKNTIGRDESCDIVINNNVISSKHAVIDAEDPNGHLLYDVGSTNKTKLGKTILKPQVHYHINDGDTITFGNISALYNISRQQPTTPEKDNPLTIPETPERDGALDVVSDSSPEDKKNIDSLLDSSDLDMFDENECDTSSIQQEVVGSTIDHKGSLQNPNIYEIDTLNFDSGDLTINTAYKECLSTNPSTSDRNERINIGNGSECDSQNVESIYDICTQRSNIPDVDDLEVCDSTMKGIDSDKHNMEVSSSVSDEKSDDNGLNINKMFCEKTTAGDEDSGEIGNEEPNKNDLNIYEIYTQKSVADDAEVDRSGSVLPNEGTKNNRLEWENFPKMGSADRFGALNSADNLVCPNRNKLEEKQSASDVSSEIKTSCLKEHVGNSGIKKSTEDLTEDGFYEAATPPAVQHNEDSVEKTTFNWEEKNKSDSLPTKETSDNAKQELSDEEDILLPASQNIDMFETSCEKNDSYEKEESCDGLMKHFNESDDESISSLANQLFPVKDAKLNENGLLSKDTIDRFLFEAATQPSVAEKVIKDDIKEGSVSKVDETFSSSFFEAATQPAVAEEVNKDSALMNKVETLSPTSIGADIQPTAAEEVIKDSTLPGPSKVDETLSSSFNEAATEPSVAEKFIKDTGSVTKVGESFSSSFNEAVTEPSVAEKVIKDSGLFTKADESFSSSFNEAATEPSVAEKAIKDTGSDAKADESFSSSFNEDATEPSVAEKVIKDTGSVTKADESFSSSFFEAATQPSGAEKVIKDCGMENKVEESFSSNIIEAAAQSAVAEDIMEDSTLASKADVSFSSSFFEAATQPSVADKTIKDNLLLSNANESFSPSFFEAATQPVVVNSNSEVNKPDVSKCSDKFDTLKELKEATDAFMESEKLQSIIVSGSSTSGISKAPKKLSDDIHCSQTEEAPLNDSFFEAATQPAICNEHPDIKETIPKKEEKIMCDETGMNETFNFDECNLKQFPEDTILTQGFYEAATQPVVENSPVSDCDIKSLDKNFENSKKLKRFPFESNEIVLADREELKMSPSQPLPERSDSAADDSILLNRDNFEDNVREVETCDSKMQRLTNSEQEVSKIIDKKLTKVSEHNENLFSNQLDTHPVLEKVSHKISSNSSGCNLKISKDVDKINEINYSTPQSNLGPTLDPESDVLDVNFYEAATQPAPQDNLNACSNQTETATNKSTDGTVCKEVLMELSDSILPSKGNSITNKALFAVDTSKPDPAEVYEVNNTNRDNIDMSLSSVNFHEMLTQEVPKVEKPSCSKKFINPDRGNVVNIPKVKENVSKLNTTAELLKILEGDDESTMMESMLSEENATCKNKDTSELGKANLTEARTSKHTSEKINISALNSSVSLACNEEKNLPLKRGKEIKDIIKTLLKEGSKEDSPIVVSHKKSRKMIISDESEQSSEECIIKFKKKGCNVFPPDSQDSISSVGDKCSTNDVQKGKLKNQKNKGKMNNSRASTTLKAQEESCSFDSQQSSEEPIIKFKRKNANIFPPDSEPFASNSIRENECDLQGHSSSVTPDSKGESVLNEDSEKGTSKKAKSSNERDQSYVSRGNITLHSQEVLEELEEQFRLTAVAMSPTQLSVASESNDEVLINECDSPVIRRSERKKSENILYKPLANNNNNTDINVDRKKAIIATTSKLLKKNSSQVNPKLQSASGVTNSSSNENENPASQNDTQTLVQSVKKFKKSTPTKDLPLNKKKKISQENLNPVKDVLENLKKDSLDSSDSQSSISNSEHELGRGKRKRTRTSFDDFLLDDDFKKLSKKSSSPTIAQGSQHDRSGSQDIKTEISNNSQDISSQTQTLSVVLHDINKNSKSSYTVSKMESTSSSKNKKNVIENFEDDLILPPKKTGDNKPKIVGKKEGNVSKIKGNNKQMNESSANKGNSMSFCEKLDELFNIWGPADRVKLSPRVPKKTYKVLENEANSGKSKAKKSAEISPNNKKSETLTNCNKLIPENSSKSKPSSSRKLFSKHKTMGEDDNEPAQKKSKKSRKSSQSDSVNSSACSESSDSSSVVTRRSARRNPSPLARADENSNRKRTLQEPSKSDDQTFLAQPLDNQKKKSSAEFRNNSQTVTKKSSIASQLMTRRNKKNINQNKKNNNIPDKTDTALSDDHYIMSQEFSFRARNDTEKTPMKEEFKPPQLTVRRSARSKQCESKADKKDSHKVMFTGLSDNKFKALVTELGGEIVDSPFTCTVLVTDGVKRTAKFLSALSRGIPIVTSQWLTESSGSFEDTERFIVNDKKAEMSYSFRLKESISKAKEKKLLIGWSVFITPSVPKPEDMKSMIECSGGRCLNKEPGRWPPNSLVISCEKDKELWNQLTKRGKRPPVVSTEALFSGILQQNLKIEEYRLI